MKPTCEADATLSPCADNARHTKGKQDKISILRGSQNIPPAWDSPQDMLETLQFPQQKTVCPMVTNMEHHGNSKGTGNRRKNKVRQNELRQGSTHGNYNIVASSPCAASHSALHCRTFSALRLSSFFSAATSSFLSEGNDVLKTGLRESSFVQVAGHHFAQLYDCIFRSSVRSLLRPRHLPKQFCTRRTTQDVVNLAHVLTGLCRFLSELVLADLSGAHRVSTLRCLGHWSAFHLQLSRCVNTQVKPI